MPVELSAFAVVLARAGGLVTFASVPGLSALSVPGKAALSLCLAIVLFPASASPSEPGIGSLASEFLWGAVVGSVVGWLNETVVIAMQVVGLQAGYTYASTVDPTTHADAAVLQVFGQLLAGVLFFESGTLHVVVRVLARGAGHVQPARAHASTEAVITALSHWTGDILGAAVRLAIPVAAFLVLVDIAMGVLNRLHTHLQLMVLASPVKMLAGVLCIGTALGSAPALYRECAQAAATLLEVVAALMRYKV